jgi:hypothetical protein
MCSIQSSQKIGSHDYCWDHQQRAILEVLEVLEAPKVAVSVISYGVHHKDRCIAYQLAVTQREEKSRHDACIRIAENIEPHPANHALEIRKLIGRLKASTC